MSFELREDKSGDGGGDAPKARDDDSTSHDEEHAIVCRYCNAEISAPRFAFGMRAQSAVQVFPNPYGQMKEILTLRAAWGWRVEGWATADFTWFSGYAWRILYCEQCSHHLGWRFQAERDNEPPHFFGLLVSEIIQT